MTLEELQKEAREDLAIMDQEKLDQESFKKIYKDYGQATYNAKKKEPIVFIKMNQCQPLVVLDATYFLNWIANE